jgi:hypothetical protein
MPTLKFRFEGLDFEYIGSNDEIRDFIHTFIGQTMNAPEHKEMKARKARLVFEEDGEDVINVPLLPDEKVMEFLESKDEFTHDLTDVQKALYGRVFSSRGNGQRMYHRTANQLRVVREKLEKKHRGKFEPMPTGIRNLKKYVFKPFRQTAILAPEQ